LENILIAELAASDHEQQLLGVTSTELLDAPIFRPLGRSSDGKRDGFELVPLTFSGFGALFPIQATYEALRLANCSGFAAHLIFEKWWGGFVGLKPHAPSVAAVESHLSHRNKGVSKVGHPADFVSRKMAGGDKGRE
jgi:hypothetical protein